MTKPVERRDIEQRRINILCNESALASAHARDAVRALVKRDPQAFVKAITLAIDAEVRTQSFVQQLGSAPRLPYVAEEEARLNKAVRDDNDPSNVARCRKVAVTTLCDAAVWLDGSEGKTRQMNTPRGWGYDEIEVSFLVGQHRTSRKMQIAPEVASRIPLDARERIVGNAAIEMKRSTLAVLRDVSACAPKHPVSFAHVEASIGGKTIEAGAKPINYKATQTVRCEDITPIQDPAAEMFRKAIEDEMMKVMQRAYEPSPPFGIDWVVIAPPLKSTAIDRFHPAETQAEPDAAVVPSARAPSYATTEDLRTMMDRPYTRKMVEVQRDPDEGTLTPSELEGRR